MLEQPSSFADMKKINPGPSEANHLKTALKCLHCFKASPREVKSRQGMRVNNALHCLSSLEEIPNPPLYT